MSSRKRKSHATGRFSRVWFRLVNESDGSPYKNLSETSVNVKFTAEVDLFRKAVKMEWNVYENESTFRKDESKGRLEAGDYLKSLGSSSTDPVIVVVPLIPHARHIRVRGIDGWMSKKLS